MFLPERLSQCPGCRQGQSLVLLLFYTMHIVAGTMVSGKKARYPT